MTYTEFKKKHTGKKCDFDGSYGAQCWDLAQFYFKEVLELPSSILAGCGLVSNMLKEPKLSQLLKYFDEVKKADIKQGDVVIWTYGHIAIFDSKKNGVNYYFSQNPNAPKVMTVNNNGYRVFRKKSAKPTPTPTPKPIQKFKIGDKVIINGELYKSANEEKVSGKVKNKKTTITRYEKGTKHPYNTTGDLGWMDEEDIKLQPTKTYYPKCASKYTSFVDSLKSIKVNSSFVNRFKIAKKNGIKVYVGTASQNVKLLDLLKKGKLVK